MSRSGFRVGGHRVKLWPESLAGQLIALLLVALVGSQLLAGLLFFGERRDALLAVQRDHTLARTASVVRLLAATPPDQAQRVLEASSSRLLRFRLSQGPVPEAGRRQGRIERRLAADLAGYLEGTGAGAPRIGLTRLNGHGHYARFGLTLAVPLGPESEAPWLAASTVAPLRPAGWAWPAVAALMVSAATISLVVVLMVRRVTRPLRRLADAAEAFGRGEPGAPLEVEGPVEARRTVAAFNEMRARIRRFVDDRLRLLAAVSHDLRTPITALRLRAELIEETETREKMLETLEELQRMVEATLSFAREESTREPTRRVDLAALVEALVADFAELGRPVSYRGPESLTAELRPDALRRALRNLVDNALTYGETAEVTLVRTEEGTEIHVDDSGPGIPPEQRERVFEPFQRLESSRSRETGGVGLGLAIARSVVRGHGGDLTLHTAPGGGLRATLSLPKTAA
ncbi:sensor histidine kinase [Algihabitans albus]|uniref:sensor histidine kinase n=1 Tax=Algihabitans albus TaxID=2164067 RepID=UPI000E5CC582|nr:ATP-binding protein [Algihabitans albus]